MRFLLDPLLTPEQVDQLHQRLTEPTAPWQAGAETAGWHARQVKHNRQLDRLSPLHQALVEELRGQVLAHPLLQAAALPQALHGVLFSRCGPEEGYGRHVDNAFMAGGRADLSFTLFLSDPSSYSGGELVLESSTGEEAIRGVAGQVVVYPSTMLHRVEPVRSGERLVAVGWIQSRVRDSHQRELLFELDTVRRSLFQREGKSEEFDLLCRCYSNLLRLWGD